MGDLDPTKVKAAVTQGLKLLEPIAQGLKSDAVSEAWNALAGQATPKLLRGEITVDEWKTAVGQFGLAAAKEAPAPAIGATVNRAAQIVEEAFNPPSPLGWLIFAGVAAAGIGYWFMKKGESERQDRLPISTPKNLFGTRRKAVKIPTVEPEEEEEAEFEEID